MEMNTVPAGIKLPRPTSARPDVRARRSAWRLGKTLARRVDFRPIEAEDMRYAWGGYRLGALANMGGDFLVPNLTAEEFRAAFTREILEKYHAAWALRAETQRGFIPVGFVLGFWSHPIPEIAPYMIANMALWMPWATPRTRVESAVNFFNSMRDEIPMIGFARAQDKKFFEAICRHGIMRRVGTSFIAFADEPAAMYETRGSDG
jgi:hypothetical protein